MDSLLMLLSRSRSDTSRISLLLEMADVHITKPGELKIDLDSAAVFVGRANSLNDHLKSGKLYGRILTVKARLSREAGQRVTAIAMAERAITILQKENDPFLLAQAYLENAGNYDVLDIKQLPGKIRLVEQAVQYLRQASKTKEHIQLRAASLQFLADLYTFIPGDKKALKTLREALNDYKSINYPLIQGVYDLFGRIYYDQRDFNNAIKYELMALKTSEMVKDSSMQRCEINNTLGLIYLELNEQEKAVVYFTRALKIAEVNQDNNNTILLFTNITHAYVRMNRAEEALKFAKSVPGKYLKANGNSYDIYVPISYLHIYTSLKRFGEAQVFCDQVVKILNEHKNFDNVRYNMLMTISTFYIESKNYKLAAEYLKINEALSNQLKDPVKISQNYRLWYRFDTLMHDYKAANKHFLRFFTIHDSLFNETKSRQIQQLQIQYETEKNTSELKIKDQRILYLNASAKLQKAVLNKTNLIKNVTTGAILFLFIITILIYKQYRNKRKINKVILQTNETITQQNLIITQKNKELEFLVEEKQWLLKEVHHRVKNNLHTIICLLESQAAHLENDALRAIEKSQNRIYTMSLIHQKLYQSDDIQTIDMENYVPELVQHLRDSFGISDQIYCRVCADPVSLDPAIAIPVALIINEALTNSIKYAFPGDRRGEIRIALTDEGEWVRLEIADDGIGMLESPENLAPVSLGLQLIKGLTKELGGEVQLTSEQGFKITVIFKKKAFNYAEFSEPNILAVC
jgi:two-component sensor histidine kinase